VALAGGQWAWLYLDELDGEPRMTRGPLDAPEAGAAATGRSAAPGGSSSPQNVELTVTDR
jgi:hypothetical protein